MSSGTAKGVTAKVASTCHCFPAGALVATTAGKKAVENIRVGDKVVAHDLKTGKNTVRKVRGLFNPTSSPADFLALLDPGDRQVVVLLRSGPTRLTDVADELGYANHSAVSKRLARIRQQAQAYFDNID